MTKDYTDLDDMRGDDYIDSRNLIAALADYDDEVDPEGCNEDDPALREEIREEYGEIAEEVRALGNEIGGDWPYGATMIREDKFVEHAQQFAEDIGAVSGDAPWPGNCIDWEKAASELRMDYTSVEYGGYTYYVRA